MALVRRHGIQEPIPKAQSLQFFLSCIQDPHNPRYCAICLDGAFRECNDAETPKSGPQKLKNASKGESKPNPELWNAVVKFLFIKRTTKQMERVLTRLSECNCRLDQQAGAVRQYHNISAQKDTKSSYRMYNKQYDDEPEERQRLMKPWRSFLLNLFISLSVTIERSGSGSRSSAQGSARYWPNSATDLIPHGADALVQSILQWYHVFQDPLMFALMNSILKVCRELVIPSLAKYKFTTTVVESTNLSLIRMILHHGKITTEGPLSLVRLMEESGIIDSERRKAMAYTFYILPWQITDAVSYLATSSFTVFHKDYREALYKDCEMKAMQLCCLIIYMFHSLLNCENAPRIPVDLTAVVNLGQELFRFFQMHLPSRPTIPVHPFIKEYDESRLSMKPLVIPPRHMALEALRVFRLDMRCSNRGCTNSLHTAGKVFQRCAGCTLVGYCGRDCQKKAWKDEDYPHKRLCPIFTSMMEKAGGKPLFLSTTHGRTDTPDSRNAIKEMISNWENAQIDEDDLQLVGGWEDALEASRGFSTPPDQRELSPGFPEYGFVLELLTSADGAPRPVLLNRHVLPPISRAS